MHFSNDPCLPYLITFGILMKITEYCMAGTIGPTYSLCEGSNVIYSRPSGTIEYDKAQEQVNECLLNLQCDLWTGKVVLIGLHGYDALAIGDCVEILINDNQFCVGGKKVTVFLDVDPSLNVLRLHLKVQRARSFQLEFYNGKLVESPSLFYRLTSR